MDKKEPKDYVAIHACERFASRVMGLDIKPNTLSLNQICALTEKIFNIALDAHPNILEIGAGSFTCTKHECVIVLQDGVIVTVKHIEKDISSDFVGGIQRSGSKKKKLIWSRKGNKDGDLNASNIKYPLSNGNRYDKKSKRATIKEF